MTEIRKSIEVPKTFRFHKFMTKSLGLQGNELIVYAFLYEVGKCGTPFQFSIRTLSDTLFLSRPYVVGIIEHFVALGHVTRLKEGTSDKAAVYSIPKNT